MEITLGFVFSNGKFSSITARPLLCGDFNQKKRDNEFDLNFGCYLFLACVLISENPGVNLLLFFAKASNMTFLLNLTILPYD